MIGPGGNSGSAAALAPPLMIWGLLEIAVVGDPDHEFVDPSRGSVLHFPELARAR